MPYIKEKQRWGQRIALIMPVETSADAVAKAVYHAFKFPTQSVFGLLVGKRLQEKTFVVDAVPIMHTMCVVGQHPVLEAAITTVSSFVKTKGLVVLGSYVANERLQENIVNVHTMSAIKTLMSSDKVSSGVGFVHWQIQNDKLNPSSMFDGKAPLIQHIFSNPGESSTSEVLMFAQWSPDTCTTTSVAAERALLAVKNGLHTFEYHKLVDFEDHLDNVAVDFFNTKLVAVLP